LWQTRLLLPALVLLVPPLAAAMSKLAQFDRPSFSLRRIATMVIAIVLALSLFKQGIETLEINPFAYITGAESRQHFLMRTIGTYAETMLALDQLPAAARVQFMWEPRSYLAPRSARADALL